MDTTSSIDRIDIVGNSDSTNIIGSLDRMDIIGSIYRRETTGSIDRIDIIENTGVLADFGNVDRKVSVRLGEQQTCGGQREREHAHHRGECFTGRKAEQHVRTIIHRTSHQRAGEGLLTAPTVSREQAGEFSATPGEWSAP